MRKDNILEAEANYFAMCLLMPAQMVKDEVKKLTIDITSDETVKVLAKKFDVSLTMMAIRLAQLKIF